MSAPSQVPPEILEKLRRLLAMTVARGASENEAAIAMKMANSLLEKYGLDRASVEMTGENKDKIDPRNVTVVKTAAQSGIMPWEKKLPKVLSNLMAVDAQLDLWVRGAYCIHFIGLTSDAALAKEVYGILRDEIWAASRPEKVGPARRSFCEGVVDILRARSYEIMRERQKNAQTETTTDLTAGRALVVVKKNQLAEIIKVKFPSKPVSLRGSATLSDSYGRGMAHGQKINLDFGRGLSQGGAR